MAADMVALCHNGGINGQAGGMVILIPLAEHLDKNKYKYAQYQQKKQGKYNGKHIKRMKSHAEDIIIAESHISTSKLNGVEADEALSFIGQFAALAVKQQIVLAFLHLKLNTGTSVDLEGDVVSGGIMVIDDLCAVMVAGAIHPLCYDHGIHSPLASHAHAAGGTGRCGNDAENNENNDKRNNGTHKQVSFMYCVCSNDRHGKS
jgi:hypothetical protein